MGRQQLHISDPQNPPWSTYDELLGPFPDVMLVLSSHNKTLPPLFSTLYFEIGAHKVVPLKSLCRLCRP